MVTLPQHSYRSHLIRMLILLFILAIAAVPTLPRYISGIWVWNTPARVPHLEALQTIADQGISLPGWQTLDTRSERLGGNTWVMQAIVPETSAQTTVANKPIVVLLRPQTWHRDQPQVDWMDINGFQRWRVDSRQTLNFTPPISSPQIKRAAPVQARFFRGWNPQQTYAVLQWYAWLDGGSASPHHWFWADVVSRLRDRQRQPWVAVSVLIPMKPLGDLESARPLAQSLGELMQSTLVQQAFNPTH